MEQLGTNHTLMWAGISEGKLRRGVSFSGRQPWLEWATHQQAGLSCLT